MNIYFAQYVENRESLNDTLIFSILVSHPDEANITMNETLHNSPSCMKSRSEFDFQFRSSKIELKKKIPSFFY